jgi:hypothetical protein
MTENLPGGRPVSRRGREKRDADRAQPGDVGDNAVRRVISVVGDEEYSDGAQRADEGVAHGGVVVAAHRRLEPVPDGPVDKNEDEGQQHGDHADEHPQ